MQSRIHLLFIKVPLGNGEITVAQRQIHHCPTVISAILNEKDKKMRKVEITFLIYSNQKIKQQDQVLHLQGHHPSHWLLLYLPPRLSTH